MKAAEHDEYYILFSYSVFFLLTWLYCDIESVCKLLSYNPRLNLHTSERLIIIIIISQLNTLSPLLIHVSFLHEVP